MSVFRRVFAAAISCCLLPTSIAAASPACSSGEGFDYMGVPITFSADRSAY
ncbi:hypothetical protein [Sphingomonas sp. MMS24-J13]|uniref:hypothetical protein n=1 Tax=Sphingomonas sp. MMS24-J13 TaxID=3238686 RepID=UPI00384C78B7